LISFFIHHHHQQQQQQQQQRGLINYDTELDAADSNHSQKPGFQPTLCEVEFRKLSQSLLD